MFHAIYPFSMVSLQGLCTIQIRFHNNLLARLKLKLKETHEL